MAFRAQHSEMVTFPGHNGDKGEACHARPAGAGPFGGIVVIHHFPGWDEWTCEVARKFAHHGFAAIAPSLEDESASAVLARFGGRRDAAAQYLGISRTTLWRRLRAG